ncbi:hypothetical protein [Parabacteroides goldsteinii]|uniref:hypothetical protein n=1 Tax=Parabacteroides goldsteinii TaxID=328812 RepID=UPI003AB2BFE9
MSNEKQIFLPVEIKKEIIKTFKTTKETLWAALNYKTDSNFARMLRAAAFERGGVLYPDPKKSKGYIPDCETVFNTSEKTMVQSFGIRVKLVGNLSSGELSLFVDGEQKATFDNPHLDELSNIQATAQNLADELTTVQ